MNEASDTLRKYCERSSTIKYELLEKLAAAYLIETNIPPDQCELVESHTPSKITYYFRHKI